MTKNKLTYLILAFVATMAVIYWLNKTTPPTPKAIATHVPVPTRQLPPPEVNVKEQKINGKKVLGLRPGKGPEEIEKLQMGNIETKDWEEKLEESLMHQGGDEIQSVAIKKTESFILAQDGLALNVESAIVTVENKKAETTTFRVLVDSETGKVLRNWDQPLIDPVNPRENFGIKVDPRYHQD